MRLLLLEAAFSSYWFFVCLFQVLRQVLDSMELLEEMSAPGELTLLASERVLLRELADTLEPFSEAWEMVHGDRLADTERLVSISLALPCVLGLQKHLSEMSTPNCPSLLAGFSQALDSWLAPILEEPFYIVATILDPQFKLTWSSNPDWHKQVLLEEFSKHSPSSCGSAETQTDLSPQAPQTPPTPSPSQVSSLPRPCRLFSFIKQRPATQAKSLEQELQAYVCEEPTDEEALQYWRRRSIDFPLLAHIAKKALTVPARGTVVGSIFATADRCLRPERGRVVPKNLETLIYLKANYKLLWA